jgi:RHS repeat-associated protein
MRFLHSQPYCNQITPRLDAHGKRNFTSKMCLEYYPFGFATANSWTRDNAVSNNFLANGGTELNTTSQLYDLDYRNYDPILGRMNQVDPLASKYASHSPYNYSFNSPVVFNDPNGADPDQVHNQLFRPVIGDNGTAGGPSIANDFSTLFDQTWGSGGYDNVGGIANGNMVQTQMQQDAQNMTPQEYGFKYGDKNSWVVYNENENSDGSISKGFYLYNDRSYWNDAGSDFSSKGEALGFGVYKNGVGVGYWLHNAEESSIDWGDIFKDAKTGATVVRGLASGRRFLENVYIEQATINNAIRGVTAEIPNSLRTISAVSKIAGGAGVLASWGIALNELANGRDNTSTWVNATTNTVIIGAAILGGPITIGVAAGAGIVYGVSYLIYGKEMDAFVDNNFGYR